MAKELVVTLRKSSISQVPRNKRTVRALGLRRINQVVVHQDTPQIRGMLAQVAFMVDVEEREASS